MLHHYSISVANTSHVAQTLANMLNGQITGFGPYHNSYIIWLGDEYGTAIELYPLGTEMLPDSADWQASFTHNPNHTGFTATHAALSVPLSREQIYAVAEQQGWRAIELPRGGFNVIEFWIENRVMIELLTPDMAEDYISTTKKFRPVSGNN